MKKILLISDTMQSKNLGCQLVSHSLRSEFEKAFGLGNYSLDVIPIEHDFGSLEREVIVGEEVEKSDYDIVYVNGEGTVAGKFAHKLYNLINEVLKVNKNVYFCNFTYDPRHIFRNKINPEMKKWIEVFQKCKVVTVRDPISYVLLKEKNVNNIKLFPDIGTCISDDEQQQREYVMFGMGSIVKNGDWRTKEIISTIRKILLHFSKKYECLLMDWPCARPFSDGRYFKKALEKDIKNFTVIEGDYKNYHNFCKKSILNFTGRHHGVVMSYSAECPTVTFQSNMWKTEGDTLFYDCGKYISHRPTPVRATLWIDKIEEQISNSEKTIQKIKNRKKALKKYHNAHVQILLDENKQCVVDKYPHMFDIDSIKYYLNSDEYTAKLLNIT